MYVDSLCDVFANLSVCLLCRITKANPTKNPVLLLKKFQFLCVTKMTFILPPKKKKKSKWVIIEKKTVRETRVNRFRSLICFWWCVFKASETSRSSFTFWFLASGGQGRRALKQQVGQADQLLGSKSTPRAVALSSCRENFSIENSRKSWLFQHEVVLAYSKNSSDAPKHKDRI